MPTDLFHDLSTLAAALSAAGAGGSLVWNALAVSREKKRATRDHAADAKAARREEHIVFATTECPNTANIGKLFAKIDDLKTAVIENGPNGQLTALADEMRELRKALK
jgi:hypothetical protein